MSATRTEALSLLSNLPKDIREYEIYPRSPLSALGFLAQTSKQYEAETAFLRLLPAAIHAVWDAKENENLTALAAIALLEKNPELLFRKKQQTDHYGREIEASPYRIFLGAGDIWALKQIQKDILPLIENGEALAEAQFKEQFPNCPWPLPKDFSEDLLYDDRNKQQIAAIVKQLDTVKQLIDRDPFNNDEPLEATTLAVKALGQLFQPKPGEVIRSGLHFPLGIMKAVYETYSALHRGWSFFSLAVIKPALDALSTVDGQCCQYGLMNLDMDKGPSRRCHPSYQHSLGQPLSLRFANDKDKRGVAALVDPYDGDVLFVAAIPGYFDIINKNGRGRWAAGVFYWKTYGEQKQKLMGAIMQLFAEQSTHCRNEHDHSKQCVIL